MLDDQFETDQLQFRPNITIERDGFDPIKEEDTKRWHTPDFFEFDRVFTCPRLQFIYLIKGIAFDKLFSLRLENQNQTHSYRLLTFRCSELMSKNNNTWAGANNCPFYLQYVEEPTLRDEFRLHSFYSMHKHKLDREPTTCMYEYFFLKKQDPEFKYTARTQPRRNWRTEFMKSLTYELTTIYADQLKQTKAQSKELGIPMAVD